MPTLKIAASVRRSTGANARRLTGTRRKKNISQRLSRRNKQIREELNEKIGQVKSDLELLEDKLALNQSQLLEEAELGPYVDVEFLNKKLEKKAKKEKKATQEKNKKNINKIMKALDNLKQVLEENEEIFLNEATQDAQMDFERHANTI